MLKAPLTTPMFRAGRFLEKSWADFFKEVARLLNLENGTFTPVLYGTTTAGSNSYQSQSGTYVRLSRLVLVEIYLQLDGTAGALDSTGQLRISGLPFAVDGWGWGINIGFVTGISLGSGRQPTGRGRHGEKAIELRRQDASGSASLNDTEATDSFSIRASMAYETGD